MCIPIFYGNQQVLNPKDFMNILNEYFKIKQVQHFENIWILGDWQKPTD